MTMTEFVVGIPLKENSDHRACLMRRRMVIVLRRLILSRKIKEVRYICCCVAGDIIMLRWLLVNQSFITII